MVLQVALLGLDLGTSSAKALVCDTEGRVLGEGQHGYPVGVPCRDWVETSPEDWWRAAVLAVRQALSSVREPVQCLAIVGQMHGVVLTGSTGAALRPAILWSDGRSRDEAAALRALPATLLAQIGNEPVTGMAGCTLLWLQRHEPDRYLAARWALQPKDWLRYQLTGRAGSDASDASGTLLFDLRERRWAREVLEAIGIDVQILPPLNRASEIAGTLCSQAAEELGLPGGLPVAMGASDTASALEAAGLEGGVEALLTLGTGGQLVVRERSCPNGVARRSNVYCAAEETSWYRLAAAQNVGLALDWVRRLLGATWEQLYKACSLLRHDSPIFVPYLVGERWETGTRAGWYGLGVEHARDDLLASALEGVAFLLRKRLDDLVWNGLRPTELVLAGGGVQSAPWRDYLLGVLGTKARSAGTMSLSARGAVLLAGVAGGTYGSLNEARTTVPAAATLEAGDADTMDRGRYERFVELVDGSSGATPARSAVPAQHDREPGHRGS